MDLQIIKSKIYEIRAYRVMLDFDLAELYGVETKYLKRAVKRNNDRFPEDFMFELTKEEYKNLRCNFGTSSEHGGIRYMPFAFTEQGVAQLSSVLNNPLAIQLNISIIRAFVTLRHYASELQQLNDKLENFMLESNMQFGEIYQALTELASKENDRKKQVEERRRIGFERGKTKPNSKIF